VRLPRGSLMAVRAGSGGRFPSRKSVGGRAKVARTDYTAFSSCSKAQQMPADTIDQFNRKRARQHADRGLAGQATDRALAQSQDP